MAQAAGPVEPVEEPYRASEPVSRAGLRLALVLAVVAIFTGVLFIGGQDEQFTFVTQSAHDGEGHARGEMTPEQINQMLAELRKQVAGKPDDNATRVKLANMLFNLAANETRRGAEGNSAPLWQEAVAVYTDALKRQDAPDVRCDLGTCYFQLKQYEDAIREFETILSGNAQHANAAYNLGMALEAKGDTEGARQRWSALAQQQPQTPAGRQAKLNLEHLQHK